MSSTLFGYYGIGLRALGAAQTGLSIAGDNIANVNTPGYSRRLVSLRSGPAIAVSGGFIDDGVVVDRIRRAEDRFLSFSLHRERGGLGRQEQLLGDLRQLESAFGTIEGRTITSALDEFSNKFRELSLDSEDRATRTSALAAADRLAIRIRDTYRRLDGQREAQEVSIRSTVDEVNQLAAELANVNRGLSGSEGGQREHPALRDRRDRIVDRLSELTGGSVETAENGKLRFALPGGPTLVTGDRALPLTLSEGSGGELRIQTSGGDDITDQLRSGRLGAIIEVRDDQIDARLTELDTFAFTFAEAANAIAAGGTDLAGNAGGPLFDTGPGPGAAGAAANLIVSQALLDDVDLLAVSNDGSIGDGSGALQLAELTTTSLSGLGDESPAEFLGGILSSLGNSIVEADVAASVAGEVVADLAARKESVTGVSLDEEALDLVRYQRAYESAARFIAVLNDMSEIAVNLGN